MLVVNIIKLCYSVTYIETELGQCEPTVLLSLFDLLLGQKCTVSAPVCGYGATKKRRH